MKNVLLAFLFVFSVITTKSEAQTVPFQVGLSFGTYNPDYNGTIVDFSMDYSETQMGQPNYSSSVQYFNFNAMSGGSYIVGYSWCYAQPSLLAPLQYSVKNTSYIYFTNSSSIPGLSYNLQIQLIINNNVVASSVTHITGSTNHQKITLPSGNATFVNSFPAPDPSEYDPVILYTFNILPS